MANNGSWALERAARERALEQAEELVRQRGLVQAPVDPFYWIRAERELIHAEGDDFGEAFDGRIQYIGPRFLLCYNTIYNRWPHDGEHHPKVRFTVGHELGHFYLEAHRRALVLRRAVHGSETEFTSSSPVEREADAFAAGLLMPKRLLGPIVNTAPQPTLDLIRGTASDFQVSMTSMMVRWIQIAHFPCATLCIRQGKLEWGFISEGFYRGKFYRLRRGASVTSSDARRFVTSSMPLDRFQVGEGRGTTREWFDSERSPVPVQECYAAIPYSQSVMVFLAADEDDVGDAADEY